MMHEVRRSQASGAGAVLLRRAIALAIAGFGVYFFLGIWIPLLNPPAKIFSLSFLFVVIIPISATCLALYYLGCAKNLWRRELTSRAIQQTAVVLSSLFLIVLHWITTLLFGQIDLTSGVFVQLLLMLLLGGLFYRAVKPCLFKWFSVQEVIDFKRHRRATKLYFGYLAFLIWHVAVSLSLDLLPSLHWGAMLVLYGMIPVAWWIYRMGLRRFLISPETKPL